LPGPSLPGRRALAAALAGGAEARRRRRGARDRPLADARLARRSRTARAGRSEGGGRGVSARPASVWIVNQYAQPRGATGITRHGDLASVLRQQGHDVTVIASSFHYFRDGGLTRAARGVKD